MVMVNPLEVICRHHEISPANTLPVFFKMKIFFHNHNIIKTCNLKLIYSYFNP